MRQKVLYVCLLLFLIISPFKANDLLGFSQMYYNDCEYIPGKSPFSTLSITETTVIDNVTYYKAGDKLLLRTDGQQIVVRTTTNPTEYVLYDFSLQVGDVVPKVYYDNLEKDEYTYQAPEYLAYVLPDTVISVSTYTLLNGEQRKMLKVGRGQNNYDIVEGIGRLNGHFFSGIEYYSVSTCTNIQFLVCTAVNGELLYTMSETDLRNYGLQGDECGCFDMPVINALEPVETARLSVFPNPVRDYLELQGLGQETFVAVYDLSGQCLLRTAGKRIDVSALPSGIYLLHATAIDGRQYRNKFLKE